MPEDKQDLLITHDTKILQQILQMALGQGGTGAGVNISLPSINQINIYVQGETEKDTKLLSPEENQKLQEHHRRLSEAARQRWARQKKLIADKSQGTEDKE